ncbi:putative entry exclusion protein TrbK-alt [Bradyrhizobium lablabi]|uniref:putative entry exclusion protein TrbK-alt n=1 Tax=Bradyrhizobium lablabi TaxID=722472 RepID=UPI00090C0881|nr:putative entry exclusion protein TrbK-alt [Bradyrhizobium lablabi]SHM82420.1 conjugative transfer region protein TrbK [Bradyrhizobium lablabi]
MTEVRAFKVLSLATTVVVFVVVACTIQLRGGEDGSSPPKAEQTTDADGSELARCRSVTSEETASYQHCQKVWAENRRRFFGRKDGVAVSGGHDSAAGLAPAPKDQSRMPQGDPSVAIPEANKP